MENRATRLTSLNETMAAMTLPPCIDFSGSITASAERVFSCAGLNGLLAIGDLCTIRGNETEDVLAEVIGFNSDHALMMPFGNLDGVAYGTPVKIANAQQHIYPDASWRGRVLNALAKPIDGGPPIPAGTRPYRLTAAPLAAHRRQLIDRRLPTGIRAVDLFTPCCVGQRLGIFAGSGVGKSTLLSMLARGAEADVMVIGLIGERGRELNEFLEHSLGPEGRQRSVVVASTSDSSPLARRRAAYLTMSIAEYFRDQGADVLCLLDSVTRFAMAVREIRLAAGEAPVARGYPPTVFAELSRLLERAGPGESGGSISAMLTVLVEGDDTNEPITDAVRGILDGHIHLDREIAERGRFPAIDILKSVSRTAPACYAPEERRMVAQARAMLSEYAKMEELIELGAYQSGANATLDRAIQLRPKLEAFLAQEPNGAVKMTDALDQLREILEPGVSPSSADEA